MKLSKTTTTLTASTTTVAVVAVALAVLLVVNVVVVSFKANSGTVVVNAFSPSPLSSSTTIATTTGRSLQQQPTSPSLSSSPWSPFSPSSKSIMTLSLSPSETMINGDDISFDDDEEDYYDDDEYSSKASSLPSSTQSHAMEVFHQVALASSSSSSSSSDDPNVISTSSDLFQILTSLDVEATSEEADVLFRYLDTDKDGILDIEDFLPWYMDAATAAFNVAESFQSLIVGRRTIDTFDQTPVSYDVVRRAVQCAIAAPNRSCSEPWRFINVGPQTIAKFAKLNAQLTNGSGDELEMEQPMTTTSTSSSSSTTSVVDWTKIPGWCVVTTKIDPQSSSRSTNNNDDDGNDITTTTTTIMTETEQEDFKSVCCAIQNFMLSMWSEGVGTKWTAGHVQHTQEFANICGVDTTKERVVGCIWYGYAAGGTRYADPRRRKKTVQDVLSNLP